MNTVDVVVVGGGIVGRSVASSAARRGMSVRLVEAGGVTEGSSAGNAGHMVPSHVVPFAAPGMVRSGITSLLRRDGAFAVSHHAGPGIVPWLWRFARSTTEANVARGVPTLRTLLDLTADEIERLATGGARLDAARTGLLQVCSSDASMREAEHEVATFQRWGVRARLLSATEVREAEPALRHGVRGGVELVDDGRFDPAGLLAAVWAEASDHGATATTARVQRLEVVGDRQVRVITDEGIVDAHQVVVAAGVWTPALCAPFGPRLPIRPARGNSVTMPDGPRVRLPLLLTDQRLAVNPLADGLRITGRFELTSPSHRAISERRTKELVRRAAEVLELPADAPPQHQWTGLRPATPDGLPVIGRMPGASAVVVAAGHGMLGSTAGPGTGEAVAAILTGGTPVVDDHIVSPARFARGSRRNG